MIVVDASVAIKWVLEEADSAAAFRILDGEEELHAPDLARIEVVGAIVRRTNERLLTPAEAERNVIDWAIIERTRELRFHRSRTDRIARAARLAIELGHPLKDCVYLALAEELGCPLVTANAKFRDRAARFGRVRLLAEAAAS